MSDKVVVRIVRGGGKTYLAVRPPYRGEYHQSQRSRHLVTGGVEASFFGPRQSVLEEITFEFEGEPPIHVEGL